VCLACLSERKERMDAHVSRKRPVNRQEREAQLAFAERPMMATGMAAYWLGKAQRATSREELENALAQGEKALGNAVQHIAAWSGYQCGREK